MAQYIETVGIRVLDATLTPVAYEQVADVSSAVGLTPATFDTASYAIIQAQDQNVRWRDDGTDPTTAVGMVLAAGSWMIYTGDLSAIRLIEEAATAVVNVAYYRPAG
ncbi:MAG: hypothetical protein GY835_24565 [bacterium]|nr:hypothetical protein [bacterium]